MEMLLSQVAGLLAVKHATPLSKAAFPSSPLEHRQLLSLFPYTSRPTSEKRLN